MPTDALLKTLPILQEQIDALIEFNANSNELTNGVINSAFVLLFKDLVRLFACYNDGKYVFISFMLLNPFLCGVTVLFIAIFVYVKVIEAETA